jgi:hypothetical protein
MATAATARRAVAPAPARAPARKKAPPRPVRSLSRSAQQKANAAAAPARRTAPARHKAPARRPGGQLIPLAAGAATAVRQLPDSSLMVRMTRGRAWIAVLGVLLAGIVAVNVMTLSLAAQAGQIDQNIQALDQENSILGTRDAQRSGSARVRHDAAGLGLGVATTDRIGYVRFEPRDLTVAAERLAAAAAY